MEKATPAAWAAKHEVKEPVLLGICHEQRWVDGDQVTEEEFTAALARFLGLPLGGPRVEE